MTICPKCKKDFFDDEGTCDIDNYRPNTCSCSRCGEVYEYEFDLEGNYIIPNFKKSLGNIYKSKKEIWVEEVKGIMNSFHERNMNELSSLTALANTYYLREAINGTAIAFECGYSYEKDVITNTELIRHSQELEAELDKAIEEEKESIKEEMNQAIISIKKHGFDLAPCVRIVVASINLVNKQGAVS